MKSPRVINNQVKKFGKKLPSTPHLPGPHEIHIKCVNASDYDLKLCTEAPAKHSVSLLLSWKLFKNGPVIMFQIRFGEKTFSYFSAGSEHRRRLGCGVFFC